MNKEAKAIVDYLEEEREAIRTLCYYPDDVLNCEDLIKVMDYINQLETNIDELKKWLRICLEEEGKTISKTTSYEMGIITTLRSVIAKVEELERGKE